MNKQNEHGLVIPGRVNIATRLAQAQSAACIGAVLLAGCASPQGVVVVKPLLDPGQMAFSGAVDIGGRFRFKAVVIGDEQKIDYLKTYVYAQTERQPVLLHSAHFFAPQVDIPSRSLTGMVYVYSPRQLQYECSVFEVGIP